MERKKIYERNPDTGVVRWRYEGESHEDYPGGNDGYSFNFEHNYVEGLIRDMVNEKVEQIEEEN